jgi:hypothetical protein
LLLPEVQPWGIVVPRASGNLAREGSQRHRVAGRHCSSSREDHPIWFRGSRNDGPDSDVDLPVIKGGKFNRTRVLDSSYRAMWGVGAPVDIIIVTPEEVEKYRDVSCLVIYPALREGKVVYGD